MLARCLVCFCLGLAVNVAVAQLRAASSAVQPRIVTERVKHDSDDPAIWINRLNPAESLILGTDKDVDGALFVFGLDGRAHPEKVVRGLLRPNNVDVAYDVHIGGERRDVVVVAERLAHRLRVFTLPDMQPVDGGGIPVFEGERARDVMGIALYTRPQDGALFAVVSRSDRFAPKDGYLHQYRLVDDGRGVIRGLKSRAFGHWSGRKEIEALSVDGVGGHLYASDETFGLRKYWVDPSRDDADDEIATFGTEGFARDHEGSAVMAHPDGRRWLWVSDQQAGELRIFDLAGSSSEPNQPRFIGRVAYAAAQTDGIDLTLHPVPGFPAGLLVAMSDDRSYHFYDLAELIANIQP